MVMATDGHTLVRADSTGDGYVFPDIDLGSIPYLGSASDSDHDSILHKRAEVPRKHKEDPWESRPKALLMSEEALAWSYYVGGDR